MKALALVGAALMLAGCGSTRPPGTNPENTDPRKGRVTIFWDDPGWGASRRWDWKICTDTTLIVHIDSYGIQDRYIDNSPECAK